MTPSFFASVLVFAVVGAVTASAYPFKTDSLVRILLLTCVATSASYYYYLNAATEHNWSSKRRAPRREVASWWITVAQCVAILALWPALQLTWIGYPAVLLFLNVTYVAWDVLHYEETFYNRQDRTGLKLFGWDVAGFFFSACLLLSTVSLPPEQLDKPDSAHHAIYICLAAAALSAQSAFGLGWAIFAFRYNPFRYLRVDGTQISGERPANGLTEDSENH